jgi:hypothetical protein
MLSAKKSWVFGHVSCTELSLRWASLGKRRLTAQCPPQAPIRTPPFSASYNDRICVARSRTPGGSVGAIPKSQPFAHSPGNVSRSATLGFLISYEMCVPLGRSGNRATGQLREESDRVDQTRSNRTRPRQSKATITASSGEGSLSSHLSIRVMSLTSFKSLCSQHQV